MRRRQDNHPDSSPPSSAEDALAQIPTPAMRVDSCGSLVFANEEAKAMAHSLGIDLIALAPEGHTRNIAHALASPGESVISWPMTYGNGQILQWSYKTDFSNQTVAIFAADVTRLAKATLGHQAIEQHANSATSLMVNPTTDQPISLSFLRHLPTPVAILNQEMQYIAVSTPWVKAFLEDEDAPIGRSHYDCVHVPQVLRAAYRLALTGKCSPPIETSYICKKTGRMEWIKAQACPWHYDNGSIGGILLLNEITTDERQQKSRIKRDKEVALWQKKLETLGAVTSGIAHEINSPAQYVSDNLSFLSDAHVDLTTLINAYRQIIAETAVSSDVLHQIATMEHSMNLPYLSSECGEAIKQASAGIDEITRIVDAIKTFSNGGTRSSTAVNINTILNDSILVCKYRWKDIADVKTDLDTKIEHLMGYPDQLGQVFLAILMNAIHAIEDNRTGERGSILVSSQSFSDHVEVHIDDNGVGIPPHNRERVFDPYFTTKTPNRGSGRGLSSARKIVEDYHGGKILCASTNRNWTRFTIVLPRLNNI